MGSHGGQSLSADVHLSFRQLQKFWSSMICALLGLGGVGGGGGDGGDGGGDGGGGGDKCVHSHLSMHLNCILPGLRPHPFSPDEPAFGRPPTYLSEL